MSEKIKDGGPAFPHRAVDFASDGTNMGESPRPGAITLRDWFAGMALQGMLCANAPAMDEVTDKNVDAVIAREAYLSADAMLAERERKP